MEVLETQFPRNHIFNPARLHEAIQQQKDIVFKWLRFTIDHETQLTPVYIVDDEKIHALFNGKGTDYTIQFMIVKDMLRFYGYYQKYLQTQGDNIVESARELHYSVNHPEWDKVTSDLYTII